MIPASPAVLYIDDDDGLRRLAARALERRGYGVTTAGDGDAGLALALSGGFDLIAVDHYMPGQDGLTVLGRLAEAGVSAPVVYVTGSEESRIAVAALKAGAADYVVKSVGDDFFDLLDRAFRQALERAALLRQRDEAEEALRSSNERLAALLREVNHRVANSLQMVSGFVQLQASALKDEAAREALRATQQRIEAIAQVHRRLYTAGDAEDLELDQYLDALVAEMQEAWSTPAAPRSLVLSARPTRLSTDRAVSLGVLVQELVSNACKYAYGPDTAGEVRIRLDQEGEELVLVVEDDGRGMDAGAAPTGTGLGGRIIAAMASSLKSAVMYDRGHAGVRAVLRFRG